MVSVLNLSLNAAGVALDLAGIKLGIFSRNISVYDQKEFEAIREKQQQRKAAVGNYKNDMLGAMKAGAAFAISSRVTSVSYSFSP